MLLVFPIGPHLQEKTLEGMSIIVFVRWMLFMPLCFLISAIAYLVLDEIAPNLAEHFKERYLMPLLICSYLVLVARDIWIVRQTTVRWGGHRVHSQTVMKRLPQLLVVLVPLFFFVERPSNANSAMVWASDMLWVFSVFSVFFYVVYFVLLLSILKVPKGPAMAGFALAIVASAWGWNRIADRDIEKDANTAFDQKAKNWMPLTTLMVGVKGTDSNYQTNPEAGSLSLRVATGPAR